MANMELVYIQCSRVECIPRHVRIFITRLLDWGGRSWNNGQLFRC